MIQIKNAFGQAQAFASRTQSGPPRWAKQSMGKAGCLIYLNAAAGRAGQFLKMWQPISTAPTDRDIELAVLDRDGPHALVFPCRRISAGFMNALSHERLDVRPTHWREWQTRNVSAGC